MTKISGLDSYRHYFFELGKCYEHPKNGKQIYVCGVADTLVFGRTFMVEVGNIKGEDSFSFGPIDLYDLDFYRDEDEYKWFEIPIERFQCSRILLRLQVRHTHGTQKTKTEQDMLPIFKKGVSDAYQAVWGTRCSSGVLVWWSGKKPEKTQVDEHEETCPECIRIKRKEKIDKICSRLVTR